MTTYFTVYLKIILYILKVRQTFLDIKTKLFQVHPAYCSTALLLCLPTYTGCHFWHNSCLNIDNYTE